MISIKGFNVDELGLPESEGPRWQVQGLRKRTRYGEHIRKGRSQYSI